MKTRKLISSLVIISLLLAILLAACGTAPSPTSTPEASPTASLQPTPAPTPTPIPTPEPTPWPDTKPLLWEVEAKQGEGHIYLLGSMHVGGEGLYPLPDEILEAYESSDTLAVEFDTTEMTTSFVANVALARKMMYSDGTDITQHLSKETYDLAVDFLTKNGQYSTMYDKYNIFFWSSLVDGIMVKLSELDAAKGIDSYFLSLAHDDGKEILDVESLDFQLNLISGQPDKLQDYMLWSSIMYMDVSIDSLLSLFDAYRRGDEAALTDRLSQNLDDYELEGFSEEEAVELTSMIEDYTYDMYTARNLAMAETAEGYLEEGKNVFYVVGAAHMLGEDGIVKLLGNAGYTVTQITY